MGCFQGNKLDNERYWDEFKGCLVNRKTKGMGRGMGIELEINGVAFVEIEESMQCRPTASCVAGRTVLPKRAAFLERMENWRRVVRGPAGASGESQYCAGWAKLYVHLRTSEAAPAQDEIERRLAPLNPLVGDDVLDGWLVEAAWRTLGDYNEREALRCMYIYQWPEEHLRRRLRVRGRQIPLVMAKAENKLQAVLNSLGSLATIRSTT